MPSRKEDEIMAEHLLKGGKMLEKTCKTCGCPLFEVKGKTYCVVCAENEVSARSGEKPPAAPAAPAAQPAGAGHTHTHDPGTTCTCGTEHEADTCTCEDGGLTEELAFTIHSLCLRIQNEKDPGHVLALMNSVKVGIEALEILCRL